MVELETKVGENVVLLPRDKSEDQQRIVAVTSKKGRFALETALEQAGFEPEPPAEPSGSSITTGEVDATGLASVETDVGKVAVANVDGEYFAFNDTCTHQGCSLSTGTLDGSNVTCPCHGSTFNVTNGEVVNGPAASPVESYMVTVNGEEIQIELV